jgi:cholestenol Delta-isomerase
VPPDGPGADISTLRDTGYFAVHPLDLAGRPAILAQLWREYSLSDSRYLTADSFLVSMETVTAFAWGPLSFLCAWFIIKNHPLRHPLQSIISLGQLYGDVLYYGTFLFELYATGVHYSRPEIRYFWGYCIFLNAFWIVIPLFLLVQSTLASGRAFATVQKAAREQRKK